MQFGFGKPAAFIRAGGSIGAVVTMKSVLRCPIAFLDVSLIALGFVLRVVAGGIALHPKTSDPAEIQRKFSEY